MVTLVKSINSSNPSTLNSPSVSKEFSAIEIVAEGVLKASEDTPRMFSGAKLADKNLSLQSIKVATVDTAAAVPSPFVPSEEGKQTPAAAPRASQREEDRKKEVASSTAAASIPKDSVSSTTMADQAAKLFFKKMAKSVNIIDNPEYSFGLYGLRDFLHDTIAIFTDAESNVNYSCVFICTGTNFGFQSTIYKELVATLQTLDPNLDAELFVPPQIAPEWVWVGETLLFYHALAMNRTLLKKIGIDKFSYLLHFARENLKNAVVEDKIPFEKLMEVFKKYSADQYIMEGLKETFASFEKMAKAKIDSELPILLSSPFDEGTKEDKAYKLFSKGFAATMAVNRIYHQFDKYKIVSNVVIDKLKNKSISFKKTCTTEAEQAVWNQFWDANDYWFKRFDTLYTWARAEAGFDDSEAKAKEAEAARIEAEKKTKADGCCTIQ